MSGCSEVYGNFIWWWSHDRTESRHPSQFWEMHVVTFSKLVCMSRCFAGKSFAHKWHHWHNEANTFLNNVTLKSETPKGRGRLSGESGMILTTISFRAARINQWLGESIGGKLPATLIINDLFKSSKCQISTGYSFFNVRICCFS